MTDYSKSKFSDSICEQLYELSMDGGADSQLGSDVGFEDGWWWLMQETGVPGVRHAILYEDSQGFVTYESFDESIQLNNRWHELVKNFDSCYGNDNKDII